MKRRRTRKPPPQPAPPDRGDGRADEPRPAEPTPDEAAGTEPVAEDPSPADEPDEHVIDLLVDEMVLARAQMDAGLAGMAEGTLRQRIAVRESEEPGADDELDALRTLLAEALWRQGRVASARAALDAVRAGSPQRRLPIAALIEAEALAAAGEPDRAAGAVERVVSAIGVDQAHELRTGVGGRVTWPLPSELQPAVAPAPRPPWSSRGAARVESDDVSSVGDERTSAARRLLEEARVAYVSGDLARGDSEMSIAVRLDPALATDGVAILEPTLGGQPSHERLLLYGDLLRAAGRRVEASQAYDRAADRRS